VSGQINPTAQREILTDEDRDVRDWATFALASQTELDTPDLREGLRARLADSDPEIRGEALVGLSKRQDGYLKSAILDELNGEFHGDWVFEAAGAMPDTAFIPALESMRTRMGADLPDRFFAHLDEALLACERRAHPTRTDNGV
jgi:HEAT repeat protein